MKSVFSQQNFLLYFQFKHLTGSTADTMLEYIQRNLPEGMAMKTTKVSRLALLTFLAHLSRRLMVSL